MDKQHTFKVNDIISYEWGYDQTNVYFYQVVGVTPKTIKLRRIRSATTENGFMSGSAKPLIDNFKDTDIIVKKPYYYSGEWNVCFDYGIGRMLTKDAKYCSWYA